MRTLSAIVVSVFSLLCIQCARLGPVSGADDSVGFWRSQQPLNRGNTPVTTSGPSSPNQLIRQVNLKVDYVSKSSRFRRVSRPMVPQFITIHSTENYSGTGDAEQHSKALKAGRLPAIWHFTVDDHKAVQHIPTNEQGIHADINKPGYSAPGNRTSIGIEMCENRGGNLGNTVDRTAKLTAYLMIKNGIPLSRVVPHYHWPRWGRRPPNKNCPHFLMDNGRPGAKWRWFLGKVNYYYKQANQPELRRTMTGITHGSPGNRETYLDPDHFYVCQRCTACCKWPGDVRIEEDEIAPIAGHLGLSEADFLDRYTRLRMNRNGLSLLEKENHECIMLENGGCRIHAVKPEQCRGFPNKWNFADWQSVCDAKAIPMEEARQRGWA